MKEKKTRGAPTKPVEEKKASLTVYIRNKNYEIVKEKVIKVIQKFDK